MCEYVHIHTCPWLCKRKFPILLLKVQMWGHLDLKFKFTNWEKQQFSELQPQRWEQAINVYFILNSAQGQGRTKGWPSECIIFYTANMSLSNSIILYIHNWNPYYESDTNFTVQSWASHIKLYFKNSTHSKVPCCCEINP